MYAEQKGRYRWEDTDEVEQEALVGCWLYMGKKGVLRPDAWQAAPWGDEFLKKVFYERRFQDLMACWHFVDNQFVTEEMKKKDAFWPLRPLLMKLNANFPKYWQPDQHLSCDEMTTPFKGRHRAKQYNKDKPAKWGFKSFALCDGTGYCICLHPYHGRDEARPDDQCLGTFAVLVVLSSD